MSDTAPASRPGDRDPEVVVTQRELRNRSGEIMRGLERGQRYLITSNGSPVGELTPRHRRHFAPRSLVAEAFSGAPPVDLARLRADLDAHADQDPAPRMDATTRGASGTGPSRTQA